MALHGVESPDPPLARGLRDVLRVRLVYFTVEGRSFRAKREHRKGFEERFLVEQGQNLALTVLYVPSQKV